MIWIYACGFFQNPEIMFCYFFRILKLDIFRALIPQKCKGSMHLVIATSPTVLGRSFNMKIRKCFLESWNDFCHFFFRFLTEDYFRVLTLLE